MLDINSKFEGKFQKNNSYSGFLIVEKIDGKSIKEINHELNLHISDFKIYILNAKYTYATNNSNVIVKLEDNDHNKKILDEINNDKYDFKNSLSLEGFIENVIINDNLRLVGILQKNDNFGFVVPYDYKYNHDIYIQKKYIKQYPNNSIVTVQITKLPDGSGQNAEGKIIELLGQKEDFGIDVLAMIKNAQIPYEFPEKVLEYAKNIEQKIDDKNIDSNRRSFLDDNIFTIDGDDTKDIDDAITVKKKENGNYILNVHIADVSNYVKNNSVLDREALKRGTSVYLLDRVIPMLPFELSNGICSLNQGELRYALSCLMEINSNGEIVDSDVCKSIIKVTKRMTYKKVQEILDGNIQTQNEYKEYLNDFFLMEELAKILKKRREKEGYLNLNVAESKLILDENAKVVDIVPYVNNFSNQIIEQFMLAANISIAEKFYFLDAPFIYRNHEKPDYEKIKKIQDILKSMGINLKVQKEKVYSKELEKVLESVRGTEKDKLISQEILHSMKNAVYQDENKGHFGIGAKYYCHFTSPIRRYPDLFIHRIISYYIDNGFNFPYEKYDKYKEEARLRSSRSTMCEKNASTLERQVTKLKCCEYLSNKIGEEYDGFICSIMNSGMFIQLVNSIEGFVSYMSFDDYVVYDEDKNIAYLENKPSIKFEIGDKVRVKVINVNLNEQKIDFELLEDSANTYSKN